MGHRWSRALPHYHHRLLPRCNGYFARVRCHRRPLFQQYAPHHIYRFIYSGHKLTISVDIRTWHANIEQHASEGVNKVLIGNKCDWTDKRAVSQDEGRDLAQELGIKFIETSAKINEGVEDAFFTLARCFDPIFLDSFSSFIDAFVSGLATSRRASLIHRLMPPMHPPLRHPHQSRLTNQSRPKSRAAAHRLAVCSRLLIIYCTPRAVPCPCRVNVVPCPRNIIYTWRSLYHVRSTSLPVIRFGAWPGGLVI